MSRDVSGVVADFVGDPRGVPANSGDGSGEPEGVAADSEQGVEETGGIFRLTDDLSRHLLKGNKKKD